MYIHTLTKRLAAALPLGPGAPVPQRGPDRSDLRRPLGGRAGPGSEVLPGRGTSNQKRT